MVRAEKLPKAATAKKEATDRMDLRRIARLMGRFLAGQRKQFILAAILLIIESATALLPTLVVGVFVGKYLIPRVSQLTGQNLPQPLSPLQWLGLPSIINPDIDTVALVTIGIIVLTMVNSLADSLSEVYLARGGRMLGLNLRVALYNHLQKLSLAFYSTQRTGDLLTRVTSDVTALEDFVVNSLSDIVGSILIIIFTLYVMVANAWQVAIVAVMVIPVMAMVSNYFSQKIKSASKKQRSREGELAASAQEMLTSIRVIQTYGSGSGQQKRFAEQSEKTMASALEAAGLQARFSWVVSVLEAVATAIIIWLVVWIIWSSVGVETGPQVLAKIALLTIFTKYIQDMFKPTKKIIKEWNTVGKIYASVERIGELLDRKPAVEDMPNATIAPALKGKIEYQHVSFAYQSDDDAGKDPSAQMRLALNDVNLTIAPGEVLALVGGSGAGKSTIVQLLPRLYDPHVGAIMIDGADIRSFTLDSLRGQMSMVLQESILFTGTVADNIAYGRQEATREEVIAASMQANAHEFIEKLPEGYDTVLGERASTLSGGQRQRLAIARAFIRNTPILILDEPTTGLDAESTELVLQALRALMKGKATIIISHDLNLIRHADKIVVIKQGQVAQVGAHKELLKQQGLYADLYHKQFGRAVEEQGGQLAPVAAPAFDDEADGEAESMTPVVFQTMITRALPAPASVKAFQTMAMPALVPQQQPPPPPAPAPRATQAAPANGANAAQAAAAPANGAKAAAAASIQPAAPPPQPAKSLQTMLLRALPEDNTANGNTGAAASTAATLDDAQFDPLRSPILLQELPGLTQAFDEQAMRGYLQQALFGKAKANYTIESCEVEQGAYPIGNCALLRYQLVIRDAATGQSFQSLMNGRMFPNQIDCAMYMRDKLAPVAALMRGRPEVAPFAAPATVIEPLNMAIAAFPIDGELPTLIKATDARAMVEVFNEVLNDETDRFKVTQCRVELVDYARRQRCTLRYHVEGRAADAPVRQTVYGKVFADHQGALAGPVTAALRAWVRSNSAFRFNVPRVLAWRPDLQLSLLEAIPGEPLIGDVLKARVRGKPIAAGAMTLEQMIDACAQVVAALHSSPIKLGARRAFDDEIAALRQELAPIQRVSPALGARLLDSIERFETYAEQSDPLPLSFCHGDFTHGQFVFDGANTGLIDFDSVCQAEPALDLGQFLTYMKLAGRKGDPATTRALMEQLSERFLTTYIAAMGGRIDDPERLRIRVAVYQAIGSLRRTLRSWQKIKGDRLQNAIVQLEEELACLPQLDY